MEPRPIRRGVMAEGDTWGRWEDDQQAGRIIQFGSGLGHRWAAKMVGPAGMRRLT